MEVSTALTKRKYFPNLDGLRFLSAFCMVIFHLENIKASHGKEVIKDVTHFESLAYLDVCLFFVLSGFLITYFLLVEKRDTGKIDYKSYFKRRSLRIWPLHYLILILGYIVLPFLFGFINKSYAEDMYHHFWLNVVGCALFLSPFVLGTRGIPQTTGPVWTVGVEEVFYILWPLILRRTKNYLKIFIAIIAGVILVRNAFLLLKPVLATIVGNKQYILSAQVLISRYTYSCMAIGSIGAYLIAYDKKQILKVLYRKDLQYFVYALTITLLVNKVFVRGLHGLIFPSLHFEMYSLLFCYIIINLADNPDSILNLNYKWLGYLGRISYGIYLFHPIMRILVLETVEKVYGKEISGWQMNSWYYVFTILSTIAVAAVSYQFFERKFLSMGKRSSASSTI